MAGSAKDATLVNVMADRDALRAEMEGLQQWVHDLQSGMFINCVYCGHRYGPEDEVPATMADALKEHVERCPKHPMSAIRAERDTLAAANEQMRVALEKIKEQCGHVCPEFETCTHVACRSSYTAWAIADAALAGQPATPAVEYSARDCLLSMTDQSNWVEMSGEFRQGYADAMEQVHDTVMEFWPELSARELPAATPAEPVNAHLLDSLSIAKRALELTIEDISATEQALAPSVNNAQLLTAARIAEEAMTITLVHQGHAEGCASRKTDDYRPCNCFRSKLAPATAQLESAILAAEQAPGDGP